MTAPETLRIGLLQCGFIRPDLAARHGDYPELFADLFADTPVDIVTYDVVNGPVPAAVGDCDGWLVSGSASSVYDDEPWIASVEQFLRTVVDVGVPVVGVCFGHQLLAQALGGTVERSPRGWGAGAHRYHFTTPPADWPERWAQPDAVNLIACHQDQVTGLPEGAEVLASNDHCAVAAFRIGPSVLAIQPHPEFTPALSRDLTDVRTSLMGEERARAALESLAQPLDDVPVAAWMAGVWQQGAVAEATSRSSGSVPGR